MDKNELESMGISLLLDDVVKKPPQVAAANTGGDKGVRDIDKVISSIENGRKVSVGSDDDEECDDDEYGEDSGTDAQSDGGEESSYGGSQKAPYVDPQIEINEKKEILYQFDRLAKKGYALPRQFNMSSDINDMRAELERVKRDRAVDNSIGMQRKILMMLVTGIEQLNKTFFPNKVKLDGWGRQVQEDISEYDEIFEELYDKWKIKGKMPAEIRLLLAFAGGAVMCHLSNTLFKDTLPGMDQVLRQNPRLMKDMAAATMGMAADANSPDKEGANPMLGSLAGLMSNFFGGAGEQQPHQQQPRRRDPPPPPKMRGPTGFDQIMQDIQRKNNNSNSARIETFSTASDSEISELREDAMSGASGSVISGGRKQRILNL